MAKKRKSTAADQAVAPAVRDGASPPMPILAPTTETEDRYTRLIVGQSAFLFYTAFLLPRSRGAGLPSSLANLIEPYVEPSRTLDSMIWSIAGCAVVQSAFSWFVARWRTQEIQALEAAQAGARAPVKPSSVLQRLARIIESAATIIVASLVIHVIIFLLGAPLLRKLQYTYLLSLQISVLAVSPLAAAVSLRTTAGRWTWIRLISLFDPRTETDIAILAPMTGTVVGAWLGAIPIPLDWDRPWQSWPITPLLGCFVGHFVGSFVGLAICLVRRAVIDEARELQAQRAKAQ
ncbi:uncharacterized protein L969DRAFT_88016 [Mixia osmundae IAM 14324]|uniref:Glycosylphosphatidylinositol anchor biosynthesis protein 11 n=1 Tax=Mixia osmundae (strain CBS 9802 / IAM 14324 / JCM 22182 / KY 12970) TaxID=764103 RepID=G7E1A9_MIXOS|nr:uncharacterized protein L969DRAFT_88016 [Mixia osmundae IAM 14324]KEI38743.1 hypothetical protein L969DRAFT_88016 [Mixia osmundae IAM 14324]GAA96619.1 hypothetical protein E5Q_03289 [Mixia osmundae IAM 14324]